MSAPPELAAQRLSIDAIDHALLELVARRRELVADTFALKRQLGLPYLDAAREAELIVERRRFAERLGIPPDLAESLMRVLMADSHARRDLG